MNTDVLLARISRDFFHKHHVFQYRMQKVSEMSDKEAIRYCHWYCESNRLTEEFNVFRNKAESAYRYCAYLQEYIEDGDCCDLQMIVNGTVDASVLPQYRIDREKAATYCGSCRYQNRNLN